MQTPTEFGWRFVTFGVITPSAGGYHILPEVTTAPAAWHHMVDGLGRAPTVGTPATIPGEDRAAGQSDVRTVRNPDKTGEPHDQRHGQRFPLTVQDPIAVGETHGLGGKDENGGPTH
jgi:hypothetical protein